VYEGRGPRKENTARTAPRYLCVAHSWKHFPESYKRCLGVGSLLLLRRWHILLRAVVKLRTYVANFSSRLVSSVLNTPLWVIRSDASIPSSEGQGRGFDASGTSSPHHSPH
jgi:hypothetical protein